MTTRSSPVQVLKAQAARIARVCKESGKNSLKTAIVMDDKTLILELVDVHDMDEDLLAKRILDLMQEN